MRKLVVFLILICSASLQAESVWTGNVAVGGSSKFPGSREYFRAASNSFPLGTILKVTNPKGEASVDVTVVDRLKSPGVFLLMEVNAAKVIGIPSDYIRPVQVTPIGSTGVEMYAPVGSSELSDGEDTSTAEFLSNDPIHAYPEDDKADVSTDSLLEEDSSVTMAIIPELTMIDELGDFNKAGETLNPFDVYDTEETEDATLIQEIPQEIPNIAVIPERTEKPIESGSQILFFSPSEFRPPTGAAFEPTEQTSASRESEFGISGYEVGDGGEYIQIGAYRSREIFEARVEDIQRSNPDYPLRVATISTPGNPGVYKLLVGPIKPAEIGVVLDAVRRNSFSDAFPFIGE